MSTEGGSTTCWYLYRSHRRAASDRSDEARQATAIESALRAAHGANVHLRLSLERAPEPQLHAGVDGMAGRRWFERAFALTYAPGEWRRAPPIAPDPGGVRWQGRRTGFPGEREAPPPALGSLLSAFDAALAALGGRVRLEVGLRPVPARRWPGLDRWLALDRRPGLAEPPRAGPRRPTRAGLVELRPSPPSLLWAGSIDLWQREAERAVRPGSPLPLSASAFRTAATALDGAPWRFAPRRADRPRAFHSLFADRELLAWMPNPERTVARAGGSCSGGVPLGRCETGSVAVLPVEPGQGRHFVVVGETGTGKSSLMVSLALRAGRAGGVVLLDPLGETAEAVAAQLRRAGRPFRWIGPAAPDAEANALGGLNRALDGDPVRAQRELEAIVGALRRVRTARYAEAAYWGPRIEEMLLLAVRAAGSIAGGTLEDAYRLLARLGSGRTVLPAEARAEVEELTARVRDRPDDAEGARRLLFEIVRDPSLRRLLCSRTPTLAIAELVAPGRFAVVSGHAAEVGETTARHLLSMYLALVWSELLSRPGAPKTFVLLDEAQWFANEGLGELLRLARRRNVHVGLATQSLASLEPGIREAVRTNVADLVVFRSGSEEARELTRGIPALAPEQLVALPRGQAAVLLGKGEELRWVHTAWLPDSDARRGLDPPPSPTEAGPRPERAPGPPDRIGLPGGARSPAAGWLAAKARAPDPTGLVEVRLAELRRLEGMDDRAIRALGGELGRAGALVRSQRGRDGPVWWVDPTRLGPGPEGTDGVDRPARSPSSQPL